MMETSEDSEEVLHDSLDDALVVDSGVDSEKTVS